MRTVCIISNLRAAFRTLLFPGEAELIGFCFERRLNGPSSYGAALNLAIPGFDLRLCAHGRLYAFLLALF